VAQLSTLGHITPHKIMFTKSDKKFDQLAADPARRRDAIARYATQRTIFLCMAVIMSVFALVVFSVCIFSPPIRGEAGGAAGIGFSAVMMWLTFFIFHSDLRVLRMIDLLDKR